MSSPAKDLVVLLAPNLPKDRREEICELLGTLFVYPIPIDESVKWRHLKGAIVIAEDPSFPEFEYCVRRLDGVVVPLWARDCEAHGSLVDFRKYRLGPRYVMTKLLVCAANFSDDEKQAFYGAAEACGARWTDELVEDVTHLMASSELQITKKAREYGAWVVVPEYFDACFRLGRLCREEYYLLEDPDTSGSHPVVPVDNKTRSNPPESDDPFSRLFFLLCPSLKLTKERLHSVKQELLELGAEVDVPINLNRIPCYVCNTRTTPMYHLAEKTGLVIGTFEWLEFILQRRQFSSPRSFALHYPPPYIPIPGMSKTLITVSNYTESSKNIICSIIEIMGGRYSDGISKENTHIICASPVGHKYEQGLKWNIHVVNHLWVEDCYWKWCMQKEGRPLYQVYPHGISDIVGHFWVERKTSIPPQVEDIIKFSCGTDSISGLRWKDVIKCPNLENLLTPIPSLQSPEIKRAYSVSSKSTMFSNLGNLKRGTLCGTASVATGTRFGLDDNGANLIGNFAPTGVMKLCQTKDVKISLTRVALSRKDHEILSSLGATFVDDIELTTHLIADSIVRTEKMLCAVGLGKWIVRKEWIEMSAKAGAFIDEANYVLKDEKSESKYKFRLAEALSKARSKKLLAEKTVCCLGKLDVPHVLIKRIITCSGGNFISMESDVIEDAVKKISSGDVARPDIIVVSKERNLSALLCLKKSLKVQVVNPEVLFICILRQSLHL